MRGPPLCSPPALPGRRQSGGLPRFVVELPLGSSHLPFLLGAWPCRVVWGPWGGLSRGTPPVLSGWVGRFRCFGASRRSKVCLGDILRASLTSRSCFSIAVLGSDTKSSTSPRPALCKEAGWGRVWGVPSGIPVWDVVFGSRRHIGHQGSSGGAGNSLGWSACVLGGLESGCGDRVVDAPAPSGRWAGAGGKGSVLTLGPPLAGHRQGAEGGAAWGQWRMFRATRCSVSRN